MEPQIVFSPTDFVAILNQTLEYAYPSVVIEGELANFRVSRNRWVYFDLKDETASVKFFGTVYQLPGPLEDGLVVRAAGSPRLHPLYGFSINLASIQPVGEGSIKKAAELLRAKLEAEGLFALERKRLLPRVPEKIGLVTSAASAAAADFIKILNERWGGVEISLVDVQVQGEQAPSQLVAALKTLNRSSDLPEVIVMTRGGGSPEDLAAFSDERVVRAVAASRVPTLVAVGHEIDVSLAELAADVRASTPTNAAQVLVPDRQAELAGLASYRTGLARLITNLHDAESVRLRGFRTSLDNLIGNMLAAERERITASKRLLALLDPKAALKRGYALVTRAGQHIGSVGQVAVGDSLEVQLADGTITSEATGIKRIKPRWQKPRNHIGN